MIFVNAQTCKIEKSEKKKTKKSIWNKKDPKETRGKNEMAHVVA